MSLMQLLSVSRSFCSNVPEMGRYKLSRRGALPDFGHTGSVEQPGRRATQVELPMGRRRRVVEERGQGTLALGQVVTEGAGVEGAGARRPGKSIAAGRTEVKVAASTEEQAGIWSWLMGLGRGLGSWLRPKPRRRPKRLPVQTAFMLETVRVVRNDLTEADTEVVVMKTRKGASKQRSSTVGEDPGRPLSRIAAKLFTSRRF